VAVLAEMEGKESGAPARYRKGIRWNAAQLRRCDRELLASWQNTLQMEIGGVGKVLFCHATPRNPDDIFTRLTPQDRLVSIFAESNADVVVCGHTHMQFDRAIGRLRVVNAGSVGMPFGDPGAYWLLLGPEVEFHRTEYDLEVAASRIRRTHYPEAEEFAAHNVLLPPSEEKMLQAFGAT
jgi:diadenosine tetraphosphatase ApaH/serine/threonine PP2A family protein phosphatase